jgi:hypothetical protein
MLSFCRAKACDSRSSAGRETYEARRRERWKGRLAQQSERHHARRLLDSGAVRPSSTRFCAKGRLCMCVRVGLRKQLPTSAGERARCMMPYSRPRLKISGRLGS